MAGDGFLSRWARRKADARSGAPTPEAAPAASALAGTGKPPLPTLPAAPAASAPTATSAVAPDPPPLPTLDDVARLTKDSDFSPYVARDVDASVRNAAMKKLFSDPHFNVMDGLDTYIDDYGKPDPIPLAMLRRMNQAAVLGLFDEETDAAPKAPLPAVASPDGAGPATVAQSESPASLPAAPEPCADDDPDLQLQRDDADRRPGAGPDPGD
jgi:Protein of unknown function (DUF3306)